MNNYYEIKDGYLYLKIKVLPGSSKSSLGDIKEGMLKVKIAAAPEDGKANEELRAFFAKTLDVPKKDVVLEKGEKSRVKTLRLPAGVKGFFERLG
jgi:uncharacterized protein (TIGR00251 family)